MWQLLLGAAVAGSTGLLAKHLFKPCPSDPISQHGFLESGCETNWDEKQKQDGIFRFSSSDSAGKAPVKDKYIKKLKEKVVLNKAEKRSRGVGVEVHRKKVPTGLKKRSAKNVANKCGSVPPTDSSIFHFGLVFGIVYMMSAGRAEIIKLNSTMDETARVVQELKTKLCKRKSSCNLQASNAANEVASGCKSSDHNEIKFCSLPVIDDDEYASSVLTEEPEPESESMEMYQLEAELEIELRKLSETEVSAKNQHEPMEARFDSYRCQGVLPSELDKKLCHLLIEQQENQIDELESELNSAQSKLREKEAELQALKDCVRRLTNFSLSTISDDDAEAQGDEECMEDQDRPFKSGSETRKSLGGMNRHEVISPN